VRLRSEACNALRSALGSYGVKASHISLREVISRENNAIRYAQSNSVCVQELSDERVEDAGQMIGTSPRDD